MTVKLICVGRLKEKFYGDACAEFKKRISRFADVNIIEVSDERAPEQLSKAEMDQVKRAEGENLLQEHYPEYLVREGGLAEAEPEVCPLKHLVRQAQRAADDEVDPAAAYALSRLFPRSSTYMPLCAYITLQRRLFSLLVIFIRWIRPIWLIWAGALYF